MATRPATLPEGRSASPWLQKLERQAFRALNAVVRPSVQRGFGSPCLTPWGLVVLEHTGRRSGRGYASPLLALRLGRRVVVTTYRDEKSQWVRNLEARPDAHLWIGGRRKSVRAQVLRDDGQPGEAPIGRRAGWAARALQAGGFAVSVLEPA